MQLLPDVKDTLIHQLTVLMELTAINSALIVGLSEVMRQNPDKVPLAFEVKRTDQPMKANLKSTSVSVNETEEMLTYIKDQPGLDFRLN